MISLFLVGAVAFLLWYNFVRSLNYFAKKGMLQTKPWPILGDQWPVMFKIKSFGQTIESIYNMFPKSRYAGYYHFTNPTLLIRDPDLIKQITVKDFDHFTDHNSPIDPEVEPLWAGNLFTLKGQTWKEMRATLSGLFTSSKMKHMFAILNETAEHFVLYFLNEEKYLYELEMKDTYSRYTNDVIASAAFGLKVDSLADRNNSFYTMGKRITSLSGFVTKFKFTVLYIAPRLFKFFKLRIFSKDLSNYFRDIIYETIKVREEKGIVRQDMINLLLEARKGNKNKEVDVAETGFATVKESTLFDKYKSRQVKHLTNDEIVSQALVFFFAGFDTISTALCFGSYELAINKNVQDKLREEILETNKANNGKLTYEMLLSMKYMDMVFTEILRKWPPIQILDRICTKAYTIEPASSDEKPVDLKIGDSLMISIQGLHRDPQYYLEPDKFIPERFSEKNKHKIIPYTFVPFGVGPRACLGSRFAILEAKTLLYHLLLNFEIVPIEKTRIPLVIAKGIQNGAEDGFWLGLKRIQV